MSNTLLQNCFIPYNVASNFDTLNFGLPTLGWFNDEHYNLQRVNMSFTCFYKLNCDACLAVTNDILSHSSIYVCKALDVQHGRAIKTDDIYIYHAYTLSLLLACLQNKHRRGRLFFQEREDDEDMDTLDLKHFFGTQNETTSRTTSVQAGEDDEDIPMIDTTIAHQLNYQVPSFVGTRPNNYENMMLPKSDVFMIYRNDGTSIDEKVKHWNLIVHGDGSELARIQDDVASEDFRTLKPP